MSPTVRGDRGWWSVEGAVTEHGEADVGSAESEAEEGLGVAPALLIFLLSCLFLSRTAVRRGSMCPSSGAWERGRRRRPGGLVRGSWCRPPMPGQGHQEPGKRVVPQQVLDAGGDEFALLVCHER